MDKTIIFTVIITAIVMGVLFGGYSYYTSNDADGKVAPIIETPIQEQVSTNPTNEYTEPSIASQERSTKMNGILATVKQEYPTQDETSQRIIALCKAGNVGACSLLKDKYGLTIN
jgi:hypothetical protein